MSYKLLTLGYFILGMYVLSKSVFKRPLNVKPNILEFTSEYDPTNVSTAWHPSSTCGPSIPTRLLRELL